MKKEYWRAGYLKFYESLPEGAEKEHLATVAEDYLKKYGAAFVHFLLVNRVLNLHDPIGSCYPAIWNEYSEYAWEIVALYNEVDLAVFQVKLKEYLGEIWHTLSPLAEEEQLEVVAQVGNQISACLETKGKEAPDGL